MNRLAKITLLVSSITIVIGLCVVGYRHDVAEEKEAERQFQQQVEKDRKEHEAYWQRETARLRAETDRRLAMEGYCYHHGGIYLPAEMMCIKAERIPIPEQNP